MKLTAHRTLPSLTAFRWFKRPVNLNAGLLRASMLACVLLGTCITAGAREASKPEWKPVTNHIMTRWGRELAVSNTWTEYPRPQMVRSNWHNLNGLWDYAIVSKDAEKPATWQGRILVPFAPEAALSGVGRQLEPDQALWYRTSITHAKPAARRLLLNFEAVDYQAVVWVNGKKAGEHTGGSAPFSFDVTDLWQEGDNVVALRVLDATGGFQLRGKQSLEPKGIWYTRCSGIWQTVWIEEVPARYIADLQIVTGIDPARIVLTPKLSGREVRGENVRVTASISGTKVASAQGGGALSINIPNPRLWSPAHPNLYDLKIELLDADGKAMDVVQSYAGLRTIGRKRDANGHYRFTLNGQEIFHWGTLDQGWWPDGLLTPPSDEGMCWDVDFLKRAGFNMIRKHIKVEPRRYYAYCDRAGMLVWQDQVSGGAQPPWTRLAPNPKDAEWPDADHAQYLKEFDEMITGLGNHPSIVVWLPFNERWGQHRTMEVGKWAVERDPTRLINIATGGNFWPVGHIADAHRYPDPGFPLQDSRFNDYVKVVGEFGGHGWPVQGHLWDPEKRNWGYGGLPKDQEEYLARYTKSLEILARLKGEGISGAVYTQTTDVEGEVNGLVTYDREVEKTPAAKLAELHQKLGEEISR